MASIIVAIIDLILNVVVLNILNLDLNRITKNNI